MSVTSSVVGSLQARRACASCCWRVFYARLILLRLRKVTRGAEGPELQLKRMSFEDFVVFFCFLCCWVERSKVFLLARQVVVGPLTCEKNA